MKWQILRMKNEHQQHYHLRNKQFTNSPNRWSGQFEASRGAALLLFAEVKLRFKKTNDCSTPSLMEVK